MIVVLIAGECAGTGNHTRLIFLQKFLQGLETPLIRWNILRLVGQSGVNIDPRRGIPSSPAPADPVYAFP